MKILQCFLTQVNVAWKEDVGKGKWKPARPS